MEWDLVWKTDENFPIRKCLTSTNGQQLFNLKPSLHPSQKSFIQQKKEKYIQPIPNDLTAYWM